MFQVKKLAASIHHACSCKNILFAGLALATSLQTGIASAQTTYEINCSEENSVCRDAITLLPLRALPRPFSPIYKSQDANTDNILVENVKAFSPVYVFARQDVDFSNPADPKGWYQVGATIKQPLGWMQAKDLMEWRQALVVSYTHPGTGGEDERKPVLMFNTKKDLKSVIAAEDRPEQADKLYAQIREGQKPESVISVEPKEFLNIENTFYILPVLDFEVETSFDDETRLLQIAAAVPLQQRAAAGETTLQNQAFLQKQSGESSAQLTGATVKNLTADIVFVMDMTNSMGDFIEATKKAVAEIAKTITADPEVKKAVKFGFVGYRDNVNLIPGLEFTTKNFSPNLLEDTQFVELINQEVKAANVGSGGYEEDVYAGIKEALDSTQWRDGLRFIVLVGDASAHEPGDPMSTTNLDAARIRSLTEEKNAYTFSIHIQDERASPDWPIAEQQFSIIATNKGDTAPALFNINATNLNEFQSRPQAISGAISKVIKKAQSSDNLDPSMLAASTDIGGGSDFDALATENASTSESSAVAAAPASSDFESLSLPTPLPADEVERINAVISAALVDYLGSKEGNPPRDVTAWVMDRDLIDPRKKSMDVRLLISRDDLSSLISAVETVTDALATAELTQMKFFESLKAIVTQGVKGETISFDKAQKLSDASVPLLPKWIEGLPYRSAIQDMSDEKFEAMTPDQRAELDKSLRAKLQFYRDISENVDAWQALNDADKDSSGNKVYPLKLDDLP